MSRASNDAVLCVLQNVTVQENKESTAVISKTINKHSNGPPKSNQFINIHSHIVSQNAKRKNTNRWELATFQLAEFANLSITQI